MDRPEFYQNLSAGDYDAWVTRLQQQRIDYIVALSEQSIEAGWARSHPDKFSPAQVEPFAPGAIYRFSQK